METFLDRDLYDFTVGQAVFEHFPTTEVVYQFIDRRATVLEKPNEFLAKLKEKVEEIADTTLAMADVKYLEGLGYFKTSYLRFLQTHGLKSENVKIGIDEGKLSVKVKGTWSETIFWEVPLLAAITELYLENSPSGLANHINNLNFKKHQMAGLNFCEFGTRRRRNFNYQSMAVNILKESEGFLGTSNCHLARLYDVKNIGTTSHQWIMGNSAFCGAKTANSEAMYRWVETYEGKLGIALTDTFGTDIFLKNFDGVLSRVYDGVRQDSGSPEGFAKNIYNHYLNQGINPKYKKVLFSDGLTPLRAQEINKNLTDLPLEKVFCIGTSFTNDQKLNIVMKLVLVDGKPVVKLSDEQGKITGSIDAVNAVKKELSI